MKLTRITEQNFHYFDEETQRHFAQKKEGELFAGVLDEKGCAVAAGLFSEYPRGLMLESLAVGEEHRKKGIGSFLLREMLSLAGQAGMEEMSTLFFSDPEAEGEKIWRSFLSKNGFFFTDAEGKRSLYDLSDVLQATPFVRGSLKRPFRIKKPGELSGEEKERIRRIKAPLVDPEEVISLDNRYGGVMFEKKEICAMLVCAPFQNGVRLSSLYGNGGGVSLFPHLFEHAREAVRNECMGYEALYIDTAGKNTAEFETLFLGKLGIGAVREYEACAAVRRIK